MASRYTTDMGNATKLMLQLLKFRRSMHKQAKLHDPEIKLSMRCMSYIVLDKVLNTLPKSLMNSPLRSSSDPGSL